MSHKITLMSTQDVIDGPPKGFKKTNVFFLMRLQWLQKCLETGGLLKKIIYELIKNYTFRKALEMLLVSDSFRFSVYEYLITGLIIKVYRVTYAVIEKKDNYE